MDTSTSISNLGKSAFAALLAGFGESIGIHDLTPDEQGACTLKFDDQVVTFQQEQSSGRMIAYSVLGQLGADTPASKLRDLLSANLFWLGTADATLALDADSQKLVLERRFDTERCSPVEFEELIGLFVDTAEAWHEQFEAGVAAPTTPTESLAAHHNSHLLA